MKQLRKFKKLCLCCKKMKRRGLFSKSSRAKSGLQTYCKQCSYDKAVAWRKQNPEKRRAIEQASYEKHYHNSRWRDCRSRANKKHVPICSKPEFVSWYISAARICEYCNISEKEALRLFQHKLHIERKHGPDGYVAANMCLACQRCNLIKNGYLTFTEMKEIGHVYIKPKVQQGV